MHDLLQALVSMFKFLNLTIYDITIFQLSVVSHLIKKINKYVRNKKKIAIILKWSTKYSLSISCA